MKKMFITGMNMNEAKTYVEPEMRVIEVDMESLVAESPEKDQENGVDIDKDEVIEGNEDDFVKGWRWGF